MLSFWEKKNFINFDVIVVGAGILGLSAAVSIFEKNPGLKILVLEKGIIPSGASTKNAGFACFGSLTEISADIKSMGKDKALCLVEDRVKGLEILRNRLGDFNIDYKSYGGYELLFEDNIIAVNEIECLNKELRFIFNDDVFYLDDAKITEFGFNINKVKHLVYSPFEAQIDSGLMMTRLMNLAASKGVTLLTGAEVRSIEESGDTVTVNAASGKNLIQFTCSKAVIAVNAFTSHLNEETSVKPGRGHVIVTKPVKGLKLKGVFHMDEGFYYFRNYEDRVIFGGGRNLDFEKEQTLDFTFNKSILEDLKQKLDDIILPGTAYEIEDSWVGIMGFSDSKLPSVTKAGNIIYAHSCNGMGIALSSKIGEKISDEI